MNDAGDLRTRIARTQELLNRMRAELNALDPPPPDPPFRRRLAVEVTGWMDDNPWFGSPNHETRSVAYRRISLFISECRPDLDPTEQMDMLDELARGCPMVAEADRLDAERNGDWE